MYFLGIYPFYLSFQSHCAKVIHNISYFLTSALYLFLLLHFQDSLLFSFFTYLPRVLSILLVFSNTLMSLWLSILFNFYSHYFFSYALFEFILPFLLLLFLFLVEHFSLIFSHSFSSTINISGLSDRLRATLAACHNFG